MKCGFLQEWLQTTHLPRVQKVCSAIGEPGKEIMTTLSSYHNAPEEELDVDAHHHRMPVNFLAVLFEK
jgi:hypothetical protein